MYQKATYKATERYLGGPILYCLTEIMKLLQLSASLHCTKHVDVGEIYVSMNWIKQQGIPPNSTHEVYRLHG